MKTLIIISFFFRMFIFGMVEKECECNIPINLTDFGFIQPCSLGTYSHISTNFDEMIINLNDCKGELSFKSTNKKSTYSIEGQYINSLDTLKDYAHTFNALVETEIIVLTYFKPLKIGEWKYYKKNKLVKIEKYNKGILLETIKK